ncbi:MAG: class II fructose-bisphosphate aldolase [Thermodesulfobacteriota bacterium]
MVIFKNTDEIYNSTNSINKKNGEIELINASDFRDNYLDKLLFNAIFNDNKAVKAEARWLIRSVAGSCGMRLASIQGLYEAMGRGEVKGFAVPAINIRGMTYYVARAIFRAALKNSVAAFIFEIAKSEVGYTDQSPSEYAVAVIAAAIKEGYSAPLFIQGDHFQLKAEGYAQDPEKEISGLKKLIESAINAGFYNIDIDASTLVDLSKPTVAEQQRPNIETTAELTEFIRGLEPEAITVSVGGEIGEVGGKNSTEEELRAFMEGYLGRLKEGMKGISKISVQTGTSHGGVVLPDGSVAKVKVDFDTIEKLSVAARESYGMAGVVQHGASTLPDDAFHMFVERGAAEVHLATGFQNMIYESKHFPGNFKEDIYKYILDKLSGERKDGETEEQFIYKTRKKAFGPFKKRFWELPQDRRWGIGLELEERFEFLFKKLNVVNTVDIVRQWIKPVNLTCSLEKELINL